MIQRKDNGDPSIGDKPARCQMIENKPVAGFSVRDKHAGSVLATGLSPTWVCQGHLNMEPAFLCPWRCHQSLSQPPIWKANMGKSPAAVGVYGQ